MKKAFLLMLIFFLAVSAFAVEFIDGQIKLLINPNNGRFSLFFMNDIALEEFVPLFAAQDPRTSFLSLMVNNRTYKLGESSAFKTTIGGTVSSPSLIFESSFLVVTQNFTFIKAGSSSITNGVLITITLTNKTEQSINAGLRFLIDTELGEKTTTHFSTNVREINSETIITGSSSEQYWVSRKNNIVLVGSITSQNPPDTVHFANWKRLNDEPWKLAYRPGRNFNLLPYSVDDSAVCYYYEPASIPKGGSRTASIIFSGSLEYDQLQVAVTETTKEPVTDSTTSTTDITADNTELPPALVIESSQPGSELAASLRADMQFLQELVFRLDEVLFSGAYISDEDLASYSLLISRTKLKYSIP